MLSEVKLLLHNLPAIHLIFIEKLFEISISPRYDKKSTYIGFKFSLSVPALIYSFDSGV